MIQIEEQPLPWITETERLVLNLLVEEGPMTALKAKKKIEKTREHTAHFMNKLWQEEHREMSIESLSPTNPKKRILSKEHKKFSQSQRRYKRSLKQRVRKGYG